MKSQDIKFKQAAATIVYVQTTGPQILPLPCFFPQLFFRPRLWLFLLQFFVSHRQAVEFLKRVRDF